MKKIDKLVFGSFIGPFILTLIVVDFILLLVTLLKYFDEIMGKGLSAGTYAELFTYFSISSSPDAFPLAILLSSIMAFGNLGEHSELTAVKSSGISLTRALLPIFIFVVMLTGVTYYSNTQLVPIANLKTYSLLWDMRTKKPALDIKEGVFYDGIPGYSIKVNEKIGEEQLKDIIIYDHTSANAAGNKKVILADSGRMYSFMNQRYLALELYRGTRYEEDMKNIPADRADGGRFIRDSFQKSVIRFDLSSFDMGDTDEKLFRRSRLVQTRAQLIQGIDSMKRDLLSKKEQIFRQVSTNGFRFHSVRELPVPEEIAKPKAFYDSIYRANKEAERLALQVQKSDEQDSVSPKSGQPEKLIASAKAISDNQKNNQTDRPQRKLMSEVDNKSLQSYTDEQLSEAVAKIEAYHQETGRQNPDNLRITTALNYAINQSRTTRNILNSRLITLENEERDQRKFEVTKNQQIARSLACLIMFLIGAPIGAIIKKGGLGVPVIVSVVFFLIYYILNTIGDKWGKEGVVDPILAVWMSNALLLPVGLFFLKQAKNDSRLFEFDSYAALWQRLTKRFKKKSQIAQAGL